MAFENNQQDAFNLRNDTESLKQWQSELDKATTSIGAAEVAAEEELAALKFKNLNALQDARVAKLEQLIALEDKGIRELAKARLTLSDRQFALRKKEIQKEFQLAKNAAEELLKIKSKKTQTSVKKPTSATKDITAASKAKHTSTTAAKKDSGKTAPASSVKKVDNAKSATPEVISLLSSIDGTLTSLRDAAVAHIQSQEESSPVIPPELTKPTEPIKPAESVKPVEPVKPQELPKDTLTEVKVGEELLDVLKAGVEALLTTTEQRIADINAARESDKKVPSTTEDLKSASPKTEKADTSEHIPKETTPPGGATTPPAGADEAEPKVSEGREYSDNSAGLESVKLGIATLKDVTDGLDVNRKYLEALKNTEVTEGKSPTLDLLNNIIAEALADKKNADEAGAKNEAPPESKVSQTTLDLTDTWLKSLATATEAEEDLQEFKKDLERNTQLVALEQEQALRKTLATTELGLIKDRAKAEAAIAFNAAHRKELLDQEEQKERLGYLAEYQKLQVDSASNIAKNITAEAFIALKKQTKAAEDSIARREKASEAAEKALATLRGKGTVAEKKALLEAQIKQRAAEKDWSDAERMQKRDGESDEELQKRRENATKAEMAANSAMKALANLAQQLNAQTDKIGAKKAPIDTRLQGSRANDTILGSYWKQLARDMNKIGAVNPYFKQEDFANNIEALVNRGISFDIKQRAFLMTIQEKIANTFNVADGTLLRLIRIQQQDTTAGRLGMESALNSFLNSMYETSEYLTDVAASVRGSLEEMQALMEGAAGTELEFQVQKWMGSLYSVGMSQDAVQSIAQTFGQIASGDVSGLTGSGTGNLLIMAANEAGMSIADILQDGLDAKETNELMQAMVNYLAEIAETSSDSRVVQQQLANVYGMRASDLKAATNLASSIKDVSMQDLTYSGMLGQLNKMANSMFLRTSQGEALSNIWSNVQYTMATQMSNDPILYLLPKVATLLEDYAGGIDLPFLNVMGFGVDLNTSVAQLMNVAAMGGTILGALGPMISGLGSAVSGTIMLNNAGINTSGKAPVIARGSAQPLQHLGGIGISESGYIGNSSGEDVKKATLQDAEDDKKKQMIKAKDEESADDTATKANFAVVNIYNLLEEVAHGSQSLRGRVINNINGGGASGGSTAGGQNTVIGDNTNDGTTSAGAGKNGTDNGNWVLAF